MTRLMTAANPGGANSQSVASHRLSDDAVLPLPPQSLSGENFQQPRGAAPENANAAGTVLSTTRDEPLGSPGQKTASLSEKQQKLRQLVRELHELRDQPLVLAELAPFAPPGATLEDITGVDNKIARGSAQGGGKPSDRSPAAMHGRGRSQSWSQAESVGAHGTAPPAQRARSKEKTADLVHRWLESRSGTGTSSDSRSWSGFLDKASLRGSVEARSRCSLERRRGTRVRGSRKQRDSRGAHSRLGRRTAHQKQPSQGTGGVRKDTHKGHRRSIGATDSSASAAERASSGSRWSIKAAEQSESLDSSFTKGIGLRVAGPQEHRGGSRSAESRSSATVTVTTSSAATPTDMTSSFSRRRRGSSLPQTYRPPSQHFDGQGSGDLTLCQQRNARVVAEEEATRLQQCMHTDQFPAPADDGDGAGAMCTECIAQGHGAASLRVDAPQMRYSDDASDGLLSPKAPGLTDEASEAVGRKLRSPRLKQRSEYAVEQSEEVRGRAGATVGDGSQAASHCGAASYCSSGIGSADERMIDPEELEQQRKFLAALAKFRVAKVPAAAHMGDGDGSPKVDDAPGAGSAPASNTNAQYQASPVSVEASRSSGDSRMLPTATDAARNNHVHATGVGNELEQPRQTSHGSARSALSSLLQPGSGTSQAFNGVRTEQDTTARAVPQLPAASTMKSTQVVPVAARKFMSHSEIVPSDQLAAAQAQQKAWLQSRGGSDRSLGRRGTNGGHSRHHKAEGDYAALGKGGSAQYAKRSRRRTSSAWGSREEDALDGYARDAAWDEDEARAAWDEDEARAAGDEDEARAAGDEDEARAAGDEDEARAAGDEDEARAARDGTSPVAAIAIAQLHSRRGSAAEESLPQAHGDVDKSNRWAHSEAGQVLQAQRKAAPPTLKAKGSMRLMQRYSERFQSRASSAGQTDTISPTNASTPNRRRRSSMGDISGMFLHMDREASYQTPGTNPPVERPADGVLPHVGRDRSIRLGSSSASGSGGPSAQAGGSGARTALSGTNKDGHTPAGARGDEAAGARHDATAEVEQAGSQANRIVLQNEYGVIRGFSECSLSDQLARSSASGASGSIAQREGKSSPGKKGKGKGKSTKGKGSRRGNAASPGTSGSGGTGSTTREARAMSLGDVPSLEIRVATLKEYKRRAAMSGQYPHEDGGDDQGGVGGSSSSSSWDVQS